MSAPAHLCDVEVCKACVHLQYVCGMCKARVCEACTGARRVRGAHVHVQHRGVQGCNARMHLQPGGGMRVHVQ